MSRTWKDRPIRVRLHENMKKGLIDHDHDYIAPRSRLSSFPDRTLSVAYYKWAQKEIAEYKAYLESLGDSISYEMIEKPGVFKYNWEDGAYVSRDYTPKIIEFVVYKVWSVEPQDLCTDAEHYDSFTHTDTRNGKRARCTPAWTRDLGRWHRSKKNAPSRATVKAHLKKAADYANGDELDEDYSDATYELPYGKKAWTWDD